MARVRYILYSSYVGELIYRTHTISTRSFIFFQPTHSETIDSLKAHNILHLFAVQEQFVIKSRWCHYSFDSIFDIFNPKFYTNMHQFCQLILKSTKVSKKMIASFIESPYEIKGQNLQGITSAPSSSTSEGTLI